VIHFTGPRSEMDHHAALVTCVPLVEVKEHWVAELANLWDAHHTVSPLADILQRAATTIDTDFGGYKCGPRLAWGYGLSKSVAGERVDAGSDDRRARWIQPGVQQLRTLCHVAALRHQAVQAGALKSVRGQRNRRVGPPCDLHAR
jgi:hypothetical protein